MTVKELIMSVTFEDLLPILKESESDHLDNIYAFREAYDILRNMEPNTDYQGEVIISCNTKVNHQIINICHLDDDVWENELAKEINFKGDSKPDMREVAIRCLWELTFYGFSPSQRISTFDKMFNGCNRYCVTRLRLTNWRKVYGNIRHLADCDKRMRMEED